MTELAVNIDQGKNYYLRQEDCMNILMLKPSRNSANRFTRMLGLYL